MKIVKLERDGAIAGGLLDGDDVHIIGGWAAGVAEEMPFALSRRLGDIVRLRDEVCATVPLSTVTLAVPVDPLAKIICVGMNYRDHVGEISLEVAAHPTIFTRSLDSLSPTGADIVRPSVSETFDFEGEIAVVIGRAGRHITVNDAMSHVGGYSCFMDGSVREYQRHSLTAGKNFHRSGAMGPWIVGAESLATADPLLTTTLNGGVVQRAHASQMIFDIPHVIAYVSRWTPLRPGDVIATGTPGGVGSRRKPPLWMRAGDRIEVEVEGIGLLCNTVVDEGGAP